MEHLRVYQKILVLAPAHTFTSLTKKVSYIQRMYKDVSGVYMLVSVDSTLVVLLTLVVEWKNTIIFLKAFERLKLVLNENYQTVLTWALSFSVLYRLSSWRTTSNVYVLPPNKIEDFIMAMNTLLSLTFHILTYNMDQLQSILPNNIEITFQKRVMSILLSKLWLIGLNERL